MTYREKLQQDQPDLVDDMFTGGCMDCPSSYGYECYNEGLCSGSNPSSETLCRKCWDREAEK